MPAAAGASLLLQSHCNCKDVDDNNWFVVCQDVRPESDMISNQVEILENFSDYRIIKKLGSGGMGEVYLAEDSTLRRTVALKIIPANVASDEMRKQRFIQEARAAAAIAHPNICVVHEVSETPAGHPFIAMEYIPGDTLTKKITDQGMSLVEILDISIQIADALDEAHAKGIMHRDIKPANIIVTPRGQVKVLDFGLAKMSDSKTCASDSAISTHMNTAPGFTMGTVPYMSPEQAIGKDVDHRTDIFSLGVLLYELSTGRKPFAGSTSGELIDRILHAQPESIARFHHDAPPELDRMIRKCLEKDADRRYQAARDLLIDLKNLKRDLESGASSLTKASQQYVPTRYGNYVIDAALVIALIAAGVYWRYRDHGTINSLAILPFSNESGDPNMEYLSDGITESIINSLSRVQTLRVIPRSTVFRYKARELNPETIGRELKVRAVLIGKVLQRGDTLKIQTDLIDIDKESELWGEQYNRNRSDILQIQDEISREISENLKLRLTGEQKQQVMKRDTENIEAYQLYLKGRYEISKFTREGYENGMTHINQAIALDPNYALAYAGAAYGYVTVTGWFLPPEEAMRKARQGVQKALDIDEGLPEAHLTLGIIYHWHDYDWNAAEKEFKRAIELQPRLAIAHAF
jgi:eukaryotic-like serine/threonine-protein kinase